MAGDCGSTCPVDGGFYSYEPNIGANAVLLAAFAVLVPVVLFVGVRFRTPLFSATLSAGLLLGVAGFLGRVLLKTSPQSQGLFLLSLLGTVLGPVCISAANFLTLPHILSIYGDHISPIQPMVAGAVLYGLAAVAAVLEVVGVAHLAYDLGGMGRPGGARLVAAGLGVQLIALLCFSVLHFWFTLGVRTSVSVLDKKYSAVYQSLRFKRFLLATQLASVLLVAYCAYRVVEMATGVNGKLFQTQVVFMIMDGVVPLGAATLITVQHPGAAFGPAWAPTNPLHVQKRRSAPAPLIVHPMQQSSEGYQAHHRYNPSIRGEISPTSKRHTGYSNPPELPEGSPGLPSNPKPVYKNGSPIPSPTGTAETRHSLRPERRRSGAMPKQLVQKDSLW
ncbi:hypothetical protein ACO1O0_002350 [Amphichorda felina]